MYSFYNSIPFILTHASAFLVPSQNLIKGRNLKDKLSSRRQSLPREKSVSSLYVSCSSFYKKKIIKLNA